MAEVVFQNLEKQLPVLEELSREGVFSEDELRAIIKRRTHFEYKLQKRITVKKDILDYLEYEIKLDALRRKRSARLKLKAFNVASRGIGGKIHSLFRKGLMKFSDDLTLWMKYIDFCKTTNSIRALGLAFGKLVQQHATNPQVWLIACKHEIEHMNNFENARLLFQKALRVNKSSKELWHEYFRTELLHVEKIKKRKQLLLEGGLEVINDEDGPEPEQIEDFLSNKTAEIVFNSAIKVITADDEGGVTFRTKFIEICREFEDCESLEEIINASLERDFPTNETVRELLCMRPLFQLQRNSHIVKEEQWIEVEDKVKNEFETSVSKVKTASMYQKYFDCFVKLMQESNSPEQMERRLAVVIQVLEDSERENCITEPMFKMWNELLVQMGNEDIALQCLQRGLKMFEKSFALWHTFLLASMDSVENWEQLRSRFKTCLTSIEEADKPEAAKLFIETVMEISEEETKRVFEETIAMGKEMRQIFLPQYLKWLEETSGVEVVRDVYKIHLSGGADIDFIQTCIDIENSQSTKDINKLRFLHEKMISDHGEVSSNVWLAYISFEKMNAAEDFERVGKIYMKAKKTLKGKLNTDFVSAYALME